MRAIRIFLVLGAFCITGCLQQSGADREDNGTSSELSAIESKSTKPAWLERETEYRLAIQRSRVWLDQLKVDPIELREHDIKGKKKFVEYLDAYVTLARYAPDSQVAGLKDRIRDLAAVTYQSHYHDMARIDDKTFKQDATSYLRAAYLLDSAGLDTELYRAEIRKIKPRLDGHMHLRGSHQRMAFHWYYEHFGLEEPFDLAAGFEDGLIHARTPWTKFVRPLDVYHLTHEIFVPYQYGDDMDADFFSVEEREYLRHTLDRVTVYWIMRKNPDIVAELVSCMLYLGFAKSEVLAEAIDYLLDSQNPDGSWGNFERYRKKYGDRVDQAYYLHTTLVALSALSVAFEDAKVL